jgi:hypothetical protein
MKHERLKMSVDIQYLVEKKDMIAVFDGLIDPILCNQLIAELKPLWKAISRDGQTAGGPMPLMKTSLDATLSASKMGDNWTETLGMIESKIYEGVTSAVAWYRAEFEALHSLDNIFDTGFQLQQYPQHGGFYRQHVDSLPDDPASCNRILGCIVYLNTVEVGGETDFPMHGASVKPISGRIALFPATFTHPHVGRPALSEDKWIVSTFICNKAVPTQDTPVVPHANFEDTFSHPHDEHGNHVHNDLTGFDHFDPTDEFEWQEPGVVNA